MLPLQILSIHFDRADFSHDVDNIPRRVEVVSAPGEAYNSRKSVGKVGLDMSSVGRPTIGSHVFDGSRSSPIRFGQDFHSRRII